MQIDFVLSAQALGYHPGGLPRLLDPLNLHDDPRGLSGTEVNAIGLAETLAGLGHRVRVLTWLTQEAVGLQDGHLDFLQLDRLHAGGAHVVVAVHDEQVLTQYASALDDSYVVAYHQTVMPLGFPHDLYPQVRLSLSATRRNAWDLQILSKRAPWRVVPNGWDIGHFPRPMPVPGRMLYNTSAERGLHMLLRALPSILARVPEAHLVIWSRLETVRFHHQDLWRDINRGLSHYASRIELHGEGGSRNQMLASLATASVLTYPSEPNLPCEVLPLSVMEACASGVPVVTAPSSGFEQAFHGALDVCPSPPSQHLEGFSDRVVAMLSSPGRAEYYRTRGLRWAERHRFRHTAEEFLTAIRRYVPRVREAVHAG